VAAGLIKEPPIFFEIEKHIGALMDTSTTPNLPKFCILNSEAYQELIDFYSKEYKIAHYPETVFNGLPIVLDKNSDVRVRVLGNAYTEYVLKND
jgi:hypothetical protein